MYIRSMIAICLLIPIFSGCTSELKKPASGKTMLWAFNAPEAEGYSIKLESSNPLPGTPLVAGEEVQLKVSGTYSLTIAKHGRIILVPQDEMNNPVGSGEKQVFQEVNDSQGKFELTQKIKVPKDAKEIRLFIPLVPDGLSRTTGEITIRYPVTVK
jgi:hypothetical protein